MTNSVPRIEIRNTRGYDYLKLVCTQGSWTETPVGADLSSEESVQAYAAEQTSVWTWGSSVDWYSAPVTDMR